jgi:DNA-binding CsgD family transcriptional regulator
MVERVQIALPIARDIGDPALLLRVLTACACVTAHDADLARPYFTEAAELARESNDSWRLTQILGRQAYGAMVAGDVIEARSLAEEGRELAEAIGDDFNSRQCLMYVAWANMCRGETTLAVTQFGEMVAEATRAHDVMSRVAGLICEGFALAWHGDVERARTTAAQTLEACAELGFLIQNGYMTLVIAELVAGNPAAALEASETAIRSSTNSAIEGANLVWFSQAALACGDTARARRWADEAAAATTGMFLCLVLAVRVRVHVAERDWELAAADAYEGLTISAQMNAYMCAPDFLECLAEVAIETGVSRHAVRLLGAATVMRRRFGLPRFKIYDDDHQSLVASLRTALGDNDFNTGWAEGEALSPEEAIAYAQRGRGERKRPSTGWGSLTPTELDVVRLVAEGIPNKDIATRLFISPRTVQSHLRHVYNKLGLTSRVQLAQEAARH